MNHNTDRSPRKHQPASQVVIPRRARNAGPATDARASYERYVTLARRSVQFGDAVETENWLQHADHHFRMMREPSA